MILSRLSHTDHARLIAATEAARQRMADRERDGASRRNTERDDGPVHISVVIRAVLTRLGLPMPSREADQHD